MSLDKTYKKYNPINIYINGTDSKAYYTKQSGLERSNNIPMMHQGFYNMEIASAITIGEGSNRSPKENDILEIGFGFGYAAQKFIDMGVRSYTCIEINDELYSNALNWAGSQEKSGVPITIYNGDWEDIMPNIKGFHGVYYSMYDEAGDEKLLNNFMRLCNDICFNGAVCSIQGMPLFSNFDSKIYSIGYRPEEPSLDVFDSVFTYNLYNALNNINYFQVYYQYWDGMNWGPLEGRGGGFELPVLG